jgi:hypothetical protein
MKAQEVLNLPCAVWLSATLGSEGMARHSGVRRTERQKLNAPLKYSISGIGFCWTASVPSVRCFANCAKV